MNDEPLEYDNEMRAIRNTETIKAQATRIAELYGQLSYVDGLNSAVVEQNTKFAARIAELETELNHAARTVEAAYRYSYIVGSAKKEDAMLLAKQDTERYRAALAKGKQ